MNQWPKICSIIFSLIYIAFLKYVYITVVSQIFSYSGFVYSDPGIAMEIFSFLLALVPALMLPTGFEKPSSIILWLYFILVHVPCSFVPLYALPISYQQNIFFLLTMLASIILLISVPQLPKLSTPKVSTPYQSYIASLVAFYLVANLWIVTSYGFDFSFADLAQVYDVRSAFKEKSAGIAGPIEYVAAWMLAVINPIFMILGITRRRPTFFLMGILGALVLYGVAAHKVAIAFPFLLLFVWWTVVRLRLWAGPAFLIACSLVISSALLLDRLFDINNIFTSIFVRRVLLMQGFLTGRYYEFFSENPPAFLSHSVGKYFATFPYTANSPQDVIGHAFFLGGAAHANVNFIGDAIGNFGLLGAPVFALFGGFLLLLMDSLVENADANQKVPGILLLSLTGWNIVNSALLTTLLTHGILLALLIFWLHPRQKQT